MGSPEPVLPEPVEYESVEYESVGYEPGLHEPGLHEPGLHEPGLHEPGLHEPGLPGDGARRLSRVDPFLEAKLNPPPSRRNWVERNRLVQRLEHATSECVLTLVAAPAGYGKTTVVAQWLRQMDPHPVAWVALDAADNDPVRLWTHIATALQRAGCRFATDTVALVTSARNEIIADLLPTLINSIMEHPAPVSVVLDDYHFIRAPACHEQINFLIDHLRTPAGVVILTRSDPPLRLGRMRAAGSVAEIRADRLSFDIEETSALLRLENVEVSEQAMVELFGRTEGWPAGLYLAILSLAGRDDPEGFIHQFTGNHRYIADYLTEEVLSRHSDDRRAFILSISILERFSATLCDYVLQTEGSSSVLQDLERTNLFVVPLDVKREWFRFHHLFAAFARNELEAQDAALVTTLHDRASEWFADHSYTDAAIQHAIAAGSLPRASRLIQANWLRYVNAGRAATVQGWLRAVGAPDPEADPTALVTSAWMALLAGDDDSLEQLLSTLEKVDDDQPLPDGTKSVASACALIRGMSGFHGPEEMLAAGRRAIELETDDRSPWFGFANFVLGHAQYVRGDLAAAMSLLPKAAYSAHPLAIIRQFALTVMAMVAREQGELSQSARFAREAMAVVDEASLRAVPQASMAFTVTGESRADQGDLDAAMATLEEGLVLRRRNPGLSPWPTIHHLLAMGRVATAAGQLSLAEQLLDEAGQLMSRFPDGMEAMRARLTAAHGQLRRRRDNDHDPDPLTAREIDVLRLLQSSMNLTEIGAALYLSRNTVKTHVQAVYRKLGASSRSEAVRIARQRALI